MAKVQISRQWRDDDILQVTVCAGPGYPDSLDEARAVALRTYAEALGVTIASEADDQAQ